jgi:virulence factor Mce-like protein
MTSLERVAARLGLDPRALLGVALLGVLMLVWILMFTNTLPGLFRGSDRTVVAHFSSTQGLEANDAVRMKGITVGHVGKVTRDPSGRGVRVELKLNGDAGRIYRDAHAAIKWRTLLGANYTVAIDPGDPATGQIGDEGIPMKSTSMQVELDEITRALSLDARTGLQTTLREAPKAFADRNGLRDFVTSLDAAAPPIAEGMDALRGEQKDTDLRRLVSATSRAAAAIDAPDDGTRRVVAAAGTTFDATAARADDIKATLARSSTIMPHINATLARVDHTLDVVDPLLAELRPAAPKVAPTLASLRPAVSHADDLLARAQPLLRMLRPTVSSLSRAASTGSRVLRELAPTWERVDEGVIPDLKEVSPESNHTVAQMIAPTIEAVGGLADGFDKNGWYARVMGSGSGNALDTVPCRTHFTDPNQAYFLSCISLMSALQQIVNPPAKIFSKTVAQVRERRPALAKRLFSMVQARAGGHR